MYSATLLEQLAAAEVADSHQRASTADKENARDRHVGDTDAGEQPQKVDAPGHTGAEHRILAVLGLDLRLDETEDDADDETDQGEAGIAEKSSGNQTNEGTGSGGDYVFHVMSLSF